ncbi:MAG TPA: hypothetical protein VIP77_21805 [Jiangellaceae bacterium]
MRVVATEPFKTYYGMVCIDVAEGQEHDGEFAAFLLAGGAPVRVVDSDEADQPPAPSQSAGLDVESTAKQVLAWVGDNPERAAQARDAETARDKPRSTLLAKLDEITNA